MNARVFACGTSFTALSGREDISLRARRHTVRLRHEAEVFTANPEQPAAHGTEGSDIVAVQANNKVLSLHKLPDTPLCRLFRLVLHSLPPLRPLRLPQCRHNALSTLIVRPPLTPMHGQTKSILHFGSVSTATLAPRFVGQG